MIVEEILTEIGLLNLEILNQIVAYKEAGMRNEIFEVRRDIVTTIRELEKRISALKALIALQD